MHLHFQICKCLLPLQICECTITFPNTLNSAYNEVTFNKKSAIMKENLCTKYTPFTYKYITLNEKPPIMRQNLHIFFFHYRQSWVYVNIPLTAKCANALLTAECHSKGITLALPKVQTKLLADLPNHACRIASCYLCVGGGVYLLDCHTGHNFYCSKFIFLTHLNACNMYMHIYLVVIWVVYICHPYLFFHSYAHYFCIHLYQDQIFQLFIH